MRMTARTMVVVLALAVSACATMSTPAQRAQALVDSARLTVLGFENSRDSQMALFREQLKKAQGVLIFPNLLKAGLMVGLEGGSGVLVARGPDGTWGYPAFYTLGAGSIGWQIGGQSADAIMLLRSPAAVRAVVEHQGKLGVDIGVTVGAVGAGAEAATTANLGADVLVFSRAVGIYGGASLEGAVIARRNDLNGAYYAPGTTPRQIVYGGSVGNAHADALRRALAAGAGGLGAK